MDEDLSSLEAERLRILWRQRLMAVPGGVGWLLHCARLYNDRERLLGPDHLGLPHEIAAAMVAKESNPMPTDNFEMDDEDQPPSVRELVRSVRTAIVHARSGRVPERVLDAATKALAELADRAEASRFPGQPAEVSLEARATDVIFGEANRCECENGCPSCDLRERAAFLTELGALVAKYR